ncbi:MAG: TIGR02452 family protein [Myxococcales bacterium]|nr:TIGR02452 family protein [Myxococcales bacterium]
MEHAQPNRIGTPSFVAPPHRPTTEHAMNSLTPLPCLDDATLAAERKRELGLPRLVAAQLGTSAVAAISDGGYTNAAGAWVDWRPQVAAAIASKQSLPAAAPLRRAPPITFTTTRVQVSNETTMGAARRLVPLGGRPLALNFANGLHPGGGFLHGARAQEEVLCRSSALFATLDGDPMYAAHKARPQPDSSAWAIYSPDVPFFRSDDGTALAEPWLLSVLTCAAPVAQVIGQPASGDLLAERIARALAISHAFGHRELVLGAWGCGAFGNDPERTARDFKSALLDVFAGAFDQVVFAIADWSEDRRVLEPFRRTFAVP